MQFDAKLFVLLLSFLSFLNNQLYAICKLTFAWTLSPPASVNFRLQNFSIIEPLALLPLFSPTSNFIIDICNAKSFVDKNVTIQRINDTLCYIYGILFGFLFVFFSGCLECPLWCHCRLFNDETDRTLFINCSGTNRIEIPIINATIAYSTLAIYYFY